VRPSRESGKKLGVSMLNVPQAKDELEVDGVRGVPVDEEQEQDLAVVAAPKQTRTNADQYMKRRANNGRATAKRTKSRA
jgi:hypothetical protein